MGNLNLFPKKENALYPNKHVDRFAKSKNWDDLDLRKSYEWLDYDFGMNNDSQKKQTYLDNVTKTNKE